MSSTSPYVIAPGSSSPLGLHRVVSPRGVLPQAAWQLDPNPTILDDEVRVSVERLNLDAASFRQLAEQHHGDGPALREHVRQIVQTRGKMHNPITGSGGMLLGQVAEVGPGSPLGLAVGDRIATLVSLTCTPLALGSLSGWNGAGEQVPVDAGHAILFGRSIAAVLPPDLPDAVALSVFDVCGAPALTHRVVSSVAAALGRAPSVCVIGAAGKSGSLALAAARSAGAGVRIGVVPSEREASLLLEAGRLDAAGVGSAGVGGVVSGGVVAGGAGVGRVGGPGPLATEVVRADARDAVGLATAVAEAGGPVDVTVVCVDVPGCEHGAVLATRDRGTVVFFSMATSFAAAALGAEALAADVTMLVGNGYAAGHAELALAEFRGSAAVQALFAARLAGSGSAEVSGSAP